MPICLYAYIAYMTYMPILTIWHICLCAYMPICLYWLYDYMPILTIWHICLCAYMPICLYDLYDLYDLYAYMTYMTYMTYMPIWPIWPIWPVWPICLCADVLMQNWGAHKAHFERRLYQKGQEFLKAFLKDSYVGSAATHPLKGVCSTCTSVNNLFLTRS